MRASADEWGGQKGDDVTAFAAEELVASIRGGSIAAFEALYEGYWTRLCHFAFRYLRSVEEAEEVVQDVFFRIWRQRLEWNVIGPPDNYLYLAVRNASLDRLERAAVARRWRERVTDADADTLPSTPETPDALVLSAEFDATIERALAKLPPKRRTICLLRWTHDLTYAQIADRLGISEKTVETQISRGLKVLRERLQALRR